MKAYLAEADWAPKAGYVLSEREKRDGRAMRADQVYKNIRASVKEVSDPKVGDDDVLFRVGACGVCGSDMHALEMDAEGYTVYSNHLRFPVILGHEYSGEVVEVGKNVTTVGKGDLVCVEMIGWCGKCRVCRTGMFNQCLEMEEIGLSCDGGFAEYAVVPAKHICVINDIAEYHGDKMAALELGALAEPTCVAYAGMQTNAGGVKSGENVAVFGVGPIGLAAIKLAKAMGAARVFAFNTNPARSALAKKMGADEVLDPRALAADGISPGDLVLERTGGVGAGMIVECSGNFPSVYPEIMKCVGNGGRIVQLGISGQNANFDMVPLLRKHAHIVGSLGHAGNDIYPSVLRMMAAGLDMRDMVTGRYSLDNAAQAVKDFGQRELGHGKVLVSSHYA